MARALAGLDEISNRGVTSKPSISRKKLLTMWTIRALNSRYLVVCLPSVRNAGTRCRGIGLDIGDRIWRSGDGSHRQHIARLVGRG
jgi:hypothetical protein